MEPPSLPEGYQIRALSKGDYDRGVLETLKTLTTVGHISKHDFEQRVELFQRNSDFYTPLVIEDNEGNAIATGMLLIEAKLIHNCGLVGHIEDIAVQSSQQGKGLGLILIQSLINKAKEKGCYKVILDCSTENVEFYKKCGMKVEGTEMGFRF